MNNWFSRGQLSVLGTGFALPGDPVSNEALFDKVSQLAPDLTSRSVHLASRRLGIETRHISRSFAARLEGPQNGMRNPDLAARAVTMALDEAGLVASDLGYLIGHTITPAQPVPSNIAFVADELQFAGPHLELRQACTGFANALMIAFGLLTQPDAKPVAIVGSETGSLFFDPANAATHRDQLVNMVQMGDGAGAIILGPIDSGAHILRGAWFGTTGLGRDAGLAMSKGGSDHPGAEILSFTQNYTGIAQSGPALFEAGISAAAAQGLSPFAADWIIPHQASGKIGGQLAVALDVPATRMFGNAARVGNTGSAAIWLALAELRNTEIKSDDKVLILGAEATKYMHGGFEYVHG